MAKKALTKVAIQSHKGKPTRSSKKALDNQLSCDEVFGDSYLADLKMASDAQTLKMGLQLNLWLRTLFVFGN